MGGKLLRRVMILAGVIIIGGASASAASAANYGAIYLDSYNGAAGYSYDYPSLYTASSRALKACKSKGGTRCKRVTWYKNGCGAVAWSPRGHWGSYGRARSLQAAKIEAMKWCKKNGAGCRVRVAACTTRHY